MKKRYLFLICGILSSSNVLASDIGEKLGRSDVSYLELIANNMNLLYLVGELQKDKNKKEAKSENEMENTLTNFSVSKNHKLIIKDFYKSPVANVTNKACNEQLDKLAKQATKLSKTFSYLSPIALTINQAQEILKEAELVVYIQAKENSQLSLKCRR